jgi:hypothetical protein
MNAELLYKLGYSQALKDVKEAILKNTRFGDIDKRIILNSCDYLNRANEHK